MPEKFDPIEASRLETLFEVFTSCQAELSLPQVLALIAIAKAPGLSVNELSERLEQPQQTVSRHVSVLLGRYQLSETVVPRAFIRQEISTSDPRSRALFLSPNGLALLKALVADSHTT
ncbi:MarR family winged helix-turn-helix transcriptional regulator [Rhodopseudomonas sp. HC1]|uniref:MarR family winged helix-turn-helix transcriptional regulator n=1 Tax=Rhodopseudomonas infernalis TaxID=2897386 RepID=UPI001EE7F11A|nr:MarR family transcriptional regulator [Rhodopseudomonas infernalis]MCG6205835.1 MarR family winged helix-turn-helix transcriptional regulator [Rhodopseudomonas infernalis]